jgi:hypothetical protein
MLLFVLGGDGARVALALLMSTLVVGFAAIVVEVLGWTFKRYA